MPRMEGTKKFLRVRAHTSREQESKQAKMTHALSESARSKKHKTVEITERVAHIQKWRRDKIKPPSHPSGPGNFKEKAGERLNLLRGRVPSLDAGKYTRASTSSSEKEQAGSLHMKTNTGDWRPRLRLTEKGKGLVRNLSWSTLKENVRPKQKDPLHQWMVDHSGGTIK
ncbi:hypothetical protein F4813DRAFT_328867 [Daldinia decipiens]|uniref:uncharacterized protein n=1 Tax=Daldinia decipiens TaxID=326647 RepID=UPI0020C2DFDA|nr:uncharacterized protein F4813DRAFT_328867 [Daldinia decipiens]KAI1659913.1 hypothetical protein F4813DRAFT_328867 [Daldinia decipiens]